MVQPATQKKESNKKKLAAAIGIASVLVIGGVFAFLTAHDTVTNEFTVAEELAIEVVEPAWEALPDGTLDWSADFDDSLSMSSTFDYANTTYGCAFDFDDDNRVMYKSNADGSYDKIDFTGYVNQGMHSEGMPSHFDTLAALNAANLVKPGGAYDFYTLTQEITGNNGIPDAAEDMTPGSEVAKDPKIHNKTDIDAFAVMQVKIPTFKNADNQDTQLFTLRYNNADGVNPDWTLSAADGDHDSGVDYKVQTVDGVNYRVYTYLYKNGASGDAALLKGGADTSVLFDHIKLVNYGDDDMNVTGGKSDGVDPESVYEVIVEGHAIQELGIDPHNTANAWAVYKAQHA